MDASLTAEFGRCPFKPSHTLTPFLGLLFMLLPGLRAAKYPSCVFSHEPSSFTRTARRKLDKAPLEAIDWDLFGILAYQPKWPCR